MRKNFSCRCRFRPLQAGALALCLLLFWAAPAAPAGLETPPGPEAPASRVEPKREWRREDRLRVNPSLEFLQVVPVDEARGVEQMKPLVAEVGLEEAWAYIPAEGFWVEVGFGEDIGSMAKSHRMGRTAIFLMIRYDGLTVYHIHPRSNFIGELYDDKRKLMRTVAEALPSAADISVMVNLGRYFRKLHPKGEIRWAIRSRHGVTTYGLTPEGEAAPEVSTRRFHFDVFELDNPVLAESPARFAPTDPGLEVNRLIAEACRRRSGGQVWVRFEPR